MSGSRLSSATANPTIGPTRASESSLVLLLYILLTAAMTYPAILFLRTKVMGGPEDNFHFLWELWYVAHALFDLHKSPFFDPDVFVPFGYSLIRNQDLSPGTVLLFSPLTHFFGEVFTYNFLLLISFPLTAFGTYLLARKLWCNRVAAVLAGVIVGFCPYRFTHATGHLSLVSTQWIPFFFLYLDCLISKPRLKNAVLAGVFFGLCSWASWYYLFMTAIAAAAYVGFRIDWKASREHLHRLLKFGAAFVGVASVFVLPFLVPLYLATRGAPVDYRGAGESQAYAAAVADYFIPSTTHFWWGDKVAQLWRSGPNGLWQSEWQLYLGMAALLFATAGVFHPRRRVVIALIAMAIACLVLSFGPGIYLTHPAPLSSSTNDVAISPIPAPGRWLRLLPGFNNLRGWARLGFFVELAIGLLAAGGLTRLLEWLKQRRHASTGTQVAVGAVVIALIIFDFLPKPADMSAVEARPVDRWLANRAGSFAFMEYPIPRHGYGGPAIYSTRFTGKRIIMGNAQNPPNLAFWGDLGAFPGPATLDLLHGWGAKYILVDENLYRGGSLFWDIYQTWDSLQPELRASPRLKEVTVLDGVHVYQVVSAKQEGTELLTNGSFEEGNTNAIPGWKAVGKPTIDRTGKHSAGGRAACAVTPKNFLLSTPVPVEAGQCYRLRAREKAAPKTGALLLQLDWQNGSDGEVHAPATVPANARSARRSSMSSMTVRAPEGAKYAVVRAQAASGKVWVDDLSLKEIPNDCEPVIFVTPNPVSVASGQPGRAAVSWDTCCSGEGRVTVTSDNTPEKVLANGESGLAFLDQIKPGARYELRLYSAQQPIALTTATLTAIKRTATIVAEPNPGPAAAGLSRAKISWATLAEDDAEVFVSRDGGPEQLLARGPNGSVEVDWIAPGSSYEFRLYSRDSSRRVLAKTTVRP